jgi:hypothetical protein
MGHGAELAALRAGLPFAQLLALLRGGRFDGSRSQALSRRKSDGFHLDEIDIESGPLFAKGMTNDDFSPLFGESRDRLQFFGCQLPCCHDIVILEVRPMRQGGFPIAYPTVIPLRRKGRLALLIAHTGLVPLDRFEETL